MLYVSLLLSKSSYLFNINIPINNNIIPFQNDAPFLKSVKLKFNDQDACATPSLGNDYASLFLVFSIKSSCTKQIDFAIPNA